ncbi:30S ribosomal protein S7 [Pelagibacterales bacterium SAG-MED31]|nr:30S ribosomal protein S7 [Pelagibacterales bacterium SAG-MED31]
MSRRRAAEKRVVIPDHKFKDIVLTKFMNRIMIDGKKSTSEKIVYGAFEILSEKTEKSPIDFFHEALNNVKPSLEVRSRRVGGATYQVPMEVRPRRAQTLAMKWIVDAAIKRNEKTMRERVANEIFDAFNNKGNSVKKREETHKMAEANRAFSHFRW